MLRVMQIKFKPFSIGMDLMVIVLEWHESRWIQPIIQNCILDCCCSVSVSITITRAEYDVSDCNDSIDIKIYIYLFCWYQVWNDLMWMWLIMLHKQCKHLYFYGSLCVQIAWHYVSFCCTLDCYNGYTSFKWYYNRYLSNESCQSNMKLN